MTPDPVVTLDSVFQPRSIAVVGASADPGKRGHQILRALVGSGHSGSGHSGSGRSGSGHAKSGYAGRVHAVNRAGGRLFGRILHKSVLELPEPVDLAVLCTPAATTPKLVEQCGERGIAAAVVLAVGFGESGADGALLESRLREAGRKHAVRIVGPNTSGILNLPFGMNLIGASGIRAGNIALLVQSGNIALALMDEITERTGLGVSICCGLGNEVDVGFGEVLDYLGGHDGTAAVVAHVEGCKDPAALLAAASRISDRKPVVVVKSGRSEAGARAALSHTGAVAGPYERLRAGFRQAGVVEVERTDELVHVVSALASQPRPAAGTGVGILSDGGGQSTLVVDRLHEMGAPLARLALDTSRELRARLGPAAAVRTPVDVAGAADSDPSAFPLALDAIAADPAVGTVLLVGLFGGYAIRFDPALADAEAHAAKAMAATMRKRGKGLVAHSQYAAHKSGALDALREAGVPVIRSLEGACRAVAEVQERAKRPGPAWLPAGAEREDPAQRRRSVRATHPVIQAARRDGRATLSEIESRTLLRAAGAVFESVDVAGTAQEAAAAVAKLEVPAAMKLVSQRISHKSDAGGVALDLRSGPDAKRAFDRIVAGARSYAEAHGLPREHYQVSVCAMFPPPVAELLVGAYRDPGLGPVLTIGAGGVWVEVLRDVAHRVLKVDREEIEAALGELRVSALLDGARGGKPVPRGPIVDACIAVADCVTRWDDVEEVEINPVFAYSDRVVPVDARVVLGEE